MSKIITVDFINKCIIDDADYSKSTYTDKEIEMFFRNSSLDNKIYVESGDYDIEMLTCGFTEVDEND
jgi:hypothetical protein